jgi:hypothetical protein
MKSVLEFLNNHGD